MDKGTRRVPEGGGKVSSVGLRALKILYIIIFVVSALIVVGYCYMTYGVRPPTVEEPPAPVDSMQPVESDPLDTGEPEPAEPALVRRDQVYTCLIFGMDDGNGNTDTIMVAAFDVPNQKIGLMSIPRDTVVRLDRSPKSWNKINAAYADGGVEQMDKELEELLGIPIDYYIKIRLSAFQKLVNAIDGVWFDVPVNMNYEDPYQDLYIHINKGYQFLNGEQAMQVVRYRQSNTDDSYGDTGRAGTQQAFMKAMLSQVLSGASVGTIPELVDVLLNYVETDADTNAMLYFGREALGIDLDTALSTGTLPAEWHSPYMWVQKDEALAMINELLNPYTTEITEDMVEFFQR